MAKVPRCLVEDVGSLALGPSDRHLLSFVDGWLAAQDLAFITGKSLEEVEADLARLEGAGHLAFVEPGASKPPMGRKSRPAPQAAEPHHEGKAEPTGKPSGRASSKRPAAPSPRSSSAEQGAAPSDVVELSEEDRRAIDEIHARLIEDSDEEILGVGPDASTADVRKAYNKLARRFHPDRHFRKKLGPYKLKIEAIFGRLTTAHDNLRAIRRAEGKSGPPSPAESSAAALVSAAPARAAAAAPVEKAPVFEIPAVQIPLAPPVPGAFAARLGPGAASLRPATPEPPPERPASPEPIVLSHGTGPGSTLVSRKPAPPAAAPAPPAPPIAVVLAPDQPAAAAPAASGVAGPVKSAPPPPAPARPMAPAPVAARVLAPAPVAAPAAVAAPPVAAPANDLDAARRARAEALARRLGMRDPSRDRAAISRNGGAPAAAGQASVPQPAPAPSSPGARPPEGAAGAEPAQPAYPTSVPNAPRSAAEAFRDRFGAIEARARERRSNSHVAEAIAALSRGDYRAAAEAYRLAAELSPADSVLARKAAEVAKLAQRRRR